MGTGLSVGDWLGIGSVAAGLLNPPKTPDTSGINAAAQSAEQRASDAWNWFKSEYEKTAPDRAATTQRDNAIADAQVDAMRFATQEAKDFSGRNKTVYQPLEDKIVAGAQEFDTPARRAQAVSEATADVEGAFGRAQQDNNRAMMRMGAVPGGAATAALMQDAELAKARAVAGATGAATRNVEQQGYARMMDAAGLGKGVVGNQATQQQIATQAGAGGVNAGAGAIGASTSAVPMMAAGASASNQALQTAGQLYGQAAGITSRTRGQDLDLLSNAFNAFTRSDKKVKKKTGKVSDGEAELAEVMATPVEKDWQYDPAKGGPDDGGQPHTGPMAQSVRAKMGEAAAPGGEVIDMRVMGGKLMAAIQAVTRDVAELRDQMAARARMGGKSEQTRKAG